MIITNKALPRRTFLRGVGAALALPVLDAMVPALAASSSIAANTPTRIGFAYVPNGMIMKQWTPSIVGAGYEMSPILKPLAPFQDQMLVLSGLAQNNGVAWAGEGAGDHQRAGAVWLTGEHPKKTEGADLRAGISIDQVMAQEFRQHTQLGSLEMILDDNFVVGTCGSGYSCAYQNTLSWSTPTTPVPMENRPRAVFERLFGDLESTDASARQTRIFQERSLLDLVSQDVSRLFKALGAKDQAKLTEYLDSIRDIERRIEISEKQADRELPAVERPQGGIPSTFTEHAKLMMDLQVLAYQTDMTRVVTVMMGREANTRVYHELGLSEGYHPLSHHQNDPDKVAKILKIDKLHTEVFAYFLEKMRATPDGDGNLLDHSMIVYGSALSDGNMHEHFDIPTLLVGGASGRIKGGSHIEYSQHTPMTNLYLTMLDKLGIQRERFGDSTGKLILPSV